MPSGERPVLYFGCWLGLAVVGVANGTLRAVTYGRIMREGTAHRLSTLTAMVASGCLVWLFVSRVPFANMREAWLVGTAWVILTVVFEFGFGRCVAGHSWQRLLSDYDLRRGRLWPLFLVWIFVMPALFHHFGAAP